MTLAPIVLFVYRRPDHTKRVLEALCRNPEAAKSELFVYSDGPRDAAAEAGVQKVRELCRGLSGFAGVKLVERSENWGLGRSVIAGVSEICASHGRAIVLEDDLVASPHFLAYMNGALDRYADEEQVMQVSGHMFPVPWEAEEDAAFLPMTTSWGWATWQRAWTNFDPDMEGYSQLGSNRTLRRAFDLEGSYPYFRMLKAQRQGRIDSWAIRWWLSVFLHQGLSLFPSSSLVRNIGFDGSGTHCRSEVSLDGDMLTNPITRYPEVKAHLRQFERVRAYLAQKSSLKARLLNRLAGVFSR